MTVVICQVNWIGTSIPVDPDISIFASWDALREAFPDEPRIADADGSVYREFPTRLGNLAKCWLESVQGAK
jgi:hypothetical protein